MRNGDLLELEREIQDLGTELAYAYKRNKCERDGLVIEYELALRDVRERLEQLHDAYHDPFPTIPKISRAIEHVLELLKTL